MDTTTQPIRRALLSVYDKSGIVEFARALAARGTEIVSTGGTARLLEEHGVAVRHVDDLTGFPEMLSGRVKTLHPMVHGGILARRDDPDHAEQVARHEIPWIDAVVVNLYPFEQTVERAGATRAECIEQIDIGGPAMIRSAAKNHAHVAVVTNADQYAPLLEELHEHGGTTRDTRARFAREAFARTSAYDAAIAEYLSRDAHAKTQAMHARLEASYRLESELRYGENPHQTGALYLDANGGGTTGVARARQLHGKPLSFNNLNDADAAHQLAGVLAAVTSTPAASVIKHANPCGAATAPTVEEAVDRALSGDPLAAFGGILAVAGDVTAEAASVLTRDASFLEVVVANSFSADALEMLADRWKNLRLLEASWSPPRGPVTRQITGGLLVQSIDELSPGPASWTHAAGPPPTDDVLRAAAPLESVARALASNAVCIGRALESGGMELVGAGAGQMDRVAACRLAVEKAAERAKGSIAFSDAFFPFDDGPALLIEAGVGTIVHPGGSKRDDDTFRLCDQRGVTCLTTGYRHFRH